ncbi:MAG TPA: type II toxin-antitoxin system prevent-host-death family antitoxin [Streptosporangiaceae bacterium]|nr:type II toxin-antitoxin system prevent-host-death family antitoxin [Streptosporangiaceae bacterium]
MSISHAREHLFPLVRQVNDDHVVIEIVARNGGNAVLMSAGTPGWSSRLLRTTSSGGRRTTCSELSADGRRNPGLLSIAQSLSALPAHRLAAVRTRSPAGAALSGSGPGLSRRAAGCRRCRPAGPRRTRLRSPGPCT